MNLTIKDKISDPGMLGMVTVLFQIPVSGYSGANGILNLWQNVKDGKNLSHADVLEMLQKSSVLMVHLLLVSQDIVSKVV